MLQDFATVAHVYEWVASTVNIRVFFWAASEEYRRGVRQLRSRITTRVKNTLVAAKNVALPANITEIRFLKQLRVELSGAADPASSAIQP